MLELTGEHIENAKDWLLDKHRQGYEETIIGLIWAGALMTIAGTVGAILGTFLPSFHPDLVFRVNLWVAAGGVGCTALSVLLSRPIDELRRYKAKERLGSRYERRKHWTRLKSASILLNLLAVLASLELSLAVLHIFGADPIHLPAGLSVERVTLVIVLAISGTMAYVHRIGLKIERDKVLTGPASAFFTLAVAGAIMFVALSSVVVREPSVYPLLGELLPGHAVLFLLAAATAATGSLFIGRELPTVRALYLEEREYRAGYASREKSVVMPTMIAFALLFLVLLLTFIFELSILREFEDISQNYLVLGILGFIVIALMASVAASVSLSRSEDKTTLYRRVRTLQERTQITMLSLSAGLALVFLMAAISISLGRGLPGIEVPQKRWVDAVALGALGALGPYGFYYARERKRIRDLEERFPDFLRDLAAGRKAGLTLTNAIKVAAEGEYGALTPDVEKMADQLTWNVSFEEALDRFAERVDTPLIQRAVALINEASRSGGHVVDVLEAAAVDAREIKTLENERRLTMSLYTVVIYIAFLVFLGVAGILYGTFIPEVLNTTQGAATGGLSAVGGGPIGDIGASTLELADYRTFFFVASIAQGAGNGVLAGIMESGEPRNGLRHAFFMIFMTFVLFAFFLA